MNERPLKTGELAEALNCSRSFVYKLIEAGTIRRVARVGIEYRIPASEARRVANEFGIEIGTTLDNGFESR